jgi:lysophospholipase L1-like esterase
VRIAFLGDSLTEGSPGASYFTLLRRRLPGHDLRNMGRAGDSVVDLLARVQHAGLEPADLAFVWIGTNDAAMGEWTSWSYEAFEPLSWPDTLTRISSVYARLLGLVLAEAPVALCVPPVTADELDDAWERRVADVAELVAAAVAAEPRAALLDLASAFALARDAAPLPIRFTIDGVHLSEAGAVVVADAFAAAIEDLAKESRGA